ncbi:unnamed protein product [Orchesella dallaii]|uniref:C2H2-type domain-containing protein n=1 Tax=Orchesella dallaii TaxID=48710 RepID=A0ABP1PR88_9HEXA
MERRQRWLEAQFRRHDEGLSKIAKQLQVLQDFISLNFDSFRQYAVERERVDSISHLTYGSMDKEHHHHHLQQQSQSYTNPVAHSHHHVHLHSSSRLTPIPGPDHFPSRHGSRHHHHSTNNNNSDSEYDDGDSMDPAPESDPLPSSGPGVGGVPHSIMDLSPERHVQQQQHRYQQQQEPNSTVAEYSAAAYYGHQVAIPDSVLMDEGPTDLSTDRKSYKQQRSASSTGSISPPYHPNAQGSILGGILTSHIQPKIKAEIKEEEPSQCYAAYTRNRTDSIDSISKDKEYSAQSLWSAGTMTTIAGPGSACSTDEISVSPEQIGHRSKARNSMDDGSKSDKAMDFQNFLLSEPLGSEVAVEKCDSKMGKLSSGTPGVVSTYSPESSYRNRRNSHGENIVTPSSTAILPHKSPSTSTTTSTCSSGENSTSTATTTGSGRKGSRGEGGNSANNASKQCRYCGKTFQWLHSVKTHERLHTGIKPYACKICGARFTQNGNLKVHAKTCVEKHADSYRSRNVFICSVCTEMFSDSDALMDHQKSHDRMQWTIKEKTCQLCGEVFQKRSFLLEHEKVHVQDRTFLTSLGIEAETTTSSASSSNNNSNK